MKPLMSHAHRSHRHSATPWHVGRANHRSNWNRSEWHHARRRRGGVVLVYVALSLTVLMGVCALVVDLGAWFVRRADMQKACDAAAMAGASRLASGENAVAATDAALHYTGANGYVHGEKMVVVATSDDATERRFSVAIQKPESAFFGAILNLAGANVGARAVASYQRKSSVMVPITGRNYGVNTGPINIGLYGPEQISARGDRYGARYKVIDGRVALNPDYRPEGYNFQVTLPRDGAFGDAASLQIYDPDSFDSGVDAGAAGKRWDEGGKDRYGSDGASRLALIGRDAPTVTRFTLYSDGGTPSDFSDDTRISSREYGAAEATDKKWDNAFGLQTSSLLPGVNLRLQAQTISGSNENGFNLRVARPDDTDATFQNGGNGTSVTAIGTLPVNFGAGGSGQVSLGQVPQNAESVSIRHFDSDVGVVPGTAIAYEDGTQSYTGSALLGYGADDHEEVDAFALGTGYAGGNWNATYTAGASDNSTWDLSYEGKTGEPGTIRLVE